MESTALMRSAILKIFPRLPVLPDQVPCGSGECDSETGELQLPRIKKGWGILPSMAIAQAPAATLNLIPVLTRAGAGQFPL
jgi:hypothetical protein